MFDIIASVLTGGATGILGSLIGTVGRFLEKKQKLKEMTLQFDQEFKLQELQISSRKEELESERAIYFLLLLVISFGKSEKILALYMSYQTRLCF